MHIVSSYTPTMLAINSFLLATGKNFRGVLSKAEPPTRNLSV